MDEYSFEDLVVRCPLCGAWEVEDGVQQIFPYGFTAGIYKCAKCSGEFGR